MPAHRTAHHFRTLLVLTISPASRSLILPTSRRFSHLPRRTMTVLKAANRQRSTSSLSLADLDEKHWSDLPKFVPHPEFRGLFAGSGSDCLSDPTFAKEILQLVPAATRNQGRSPTVLYLGTATYDLPAPKARQTDQLKALGCTIVSLDVSAASPTQTTLRTAIEDADIILASGGNTLHAVDRWSRLNMVPMLREASERGAVFTGGSAGAIWVFQSGHSDSADPDTFRNPMLQMAKSGKKRRAGGPKGRSEKDENEDESSTYDANNKKEWSYIRVPGLNFLPALCCPHYDMVQSNGMLRADDFDTMLLRHAGERGIGIDHWAALCIEGERYRIISHEDRPGSVVIDEITDEQLFCPDRTGNPGVWLLEVVDNSVERWVCPSAGKVSEILRLATDIVEDTAALARCRRDNPDIAPPSPRDS